ncbi:MAG TPA: helix-turn-helix domain-containing protein [Actinocrinis sp.]|jgi:excisionase family DNA binding protein|uniref:helix-turn-helix domain-containing protein n=1 Tax=Actinocrinis sp. TaxID=1920516 RepID=UPI002DDDA1F9|nr:helix-turn-helix domain-containing protein [Actinocrinis sp.]HEV3170765.1 helix-turn-helix domain-containing protein [Actinocrinis sp.]
MLRFADAASALGVDVDTVRAQIKAGVIPTVKFGRNVLIPASALEAPAGGPGVADQLADLAARVAALEGATS